MKNQTKIYLAITLIIGLTAGYYLNRPIKNPNYQTPKSAQTPNRSNCLADDCLAISDLEYPAGELSSVAKLTLDKAITDEYKALSVYLAVIEKFGANRPFSMIKGAEEQHIAQLKAIYDKYDLALPATAVIIKIDAPATLQQACQIGVDAEIANAALYQTELLPSVAQYADFTAVFTNLMNASTNKHLVAFERCN